MKFVRLAIALLTLVTLATAQDTLSGKWKITWLQGGNPNIVNLTENNGKVSGNYINDTKESCSVFGAVTDGKIVLVTVCPNWTIDMAGNYDHTMGEPNNDEVTGRYLAYGTEHGTFRMDRQVCMLPEGCK